MLLLSDPRVALVPVLDDSEPLIPFPAVIGNATGLTGETVHVRRGLGARLVTAALSLPEGVSFKIAEGHRSVEAQLGIIARYSDEVRRAHPGLDRRELARLVSRFVSPISVAPHVAGAAVDVTLVDDYGAELDLGTEIDATPEASGGACYFDAPGISARARANRELLARALGGAGLVNYPTEWWHWSYGDRYWALVTAAPHALYGAVEEGVAA
ncbi:M15 family metallopeptidase [Gryllotalpicola koreensis]|uniref:M15 family metallopeptidase n=1 Tax=Gryllotalpicola koreensis TaxID=993086 RepID=A0ABP7ZWN3_9MICO